jgi:D-threo-aldose 1-dehydrogenase
MAQVTARRRLGRTDVQLTELGFGGASIGELFVRVSEADAAATLTSAWDAGVRYFDTAPWYGRGLSELRTGAGLRDHPRSDYALSTKVGRWLRPSTADDFDGSPWLGGLPNEVVFDYTYDGIMRSVEGSRLRLGITSFDVAWIHDLDRLYFDQPTMESHFRDLAASGWRALEELRASGQIGAIGAGINDLGLMPRFLDIGDIDAFLVAMPYTLLDQDVLDAEFPACLERGVGFVIGAVFASGILAKGPVPGAKYAYAEPSAEMVAKPSASVTACPWPRRRCSSRWATRRWHRSSLARPAPHSRHATWRPSGRPSRTICGRSSSTKDCYATTRRCRRMRWRDRAWYRDRACRRDGRAPLAGRVMAPATLGRPGR